MRIALDTNVLVYSEGAGDERRQSIAHELIVSLKDHSIVLPVQVEIELFRFLFRKWKMTRPEAAEVVSSWQDLAWEQVATNERTFANALTLAAEHEFQIFDAVILAAAAESGCRLLLSEDMQDGFVWRGVTVADPFAPSLHPMVVDLMRG